MHLFRAHTPVFLAPAIVALFTDPDRSACFRSALPLAEQLGVPGIQQLASLCDFVSSHGNDQMIAKIGVIGCKVLGDGSSIRRPNHNLHMSSELHLDEFSDIIYVQRLSTSGEYDRPSKGGVSATDSATYLFAAAGTLMLAVVAASVPAWRAARVDPLIALREE